MFHSVVTMGHDTQTIPCDFWCCLVFIFALPFTLVCFWFCFEINLRLTHIRLFGSFTCRLSQTWLPRSRNQLRSSKEPPSWTASSRKSSCRTTKGGTWWVIEHLEAALVISLLFFSLQVLFFYPLDLWVHIWLIETLPALVAIILHYRLLVNATIARLNT